MQISFPRHFVLLECVAILQVTVFGPKDWHVGLPLGLQGALHALALVGALPGSRSPVRRALYVICAALLAGAAFYAGLWLDSSVDHLWPLSLLDRARDARLVALISAPGALAYGFLVRAFWLQQLRRTDPVIIASACTAVMIVAGTLVQREDWLIVLWWFSFSAALYWFCRRRVTADDRLSEHRA